MSPKSTKRPVKFLHLFNLDVNGSLANLHRSPPEGNSIDLVRPSESFIFVRSVMARAPTFKQNTAPLNCYITHTVFTKVISGESTLATLYHVF